MPGFAYPHHSCNSIGHKDAQAGSNYGKKKLLACPGIDGTVEYVHLALVQMCWRHSHNNNQTGNLDIICVKIQN